METKANYILIGFFTLAGFLGIFAFFLWFARVELDQQFAYYDIRFSSVSGLSNASDVRFSGLPVGQVVDVRLAPDRNGTILVRAEVDAQTPVRANSVATIESLGVTGVSFLSISPGTPDTPLLAEVSDDDIPEITSGRSTLQALSEDAPQLVEETLLVMQELGTLFSDENARRIERIILNVEAASDEFAATFQAFSGVADTVDDFAGQISRFNSTLDTLTSEMNVMLTSANETLNSIDALARETTRVMQGGTEAIDDLQGAIGQVDRYVAEDLTAATRETRDMIAELRDELSRIGAETSTLIATLDQTGSTATRRLSEAEATMAALNDLVASLDQTSRAIEGAAVRIEGLIEEEGAPLLAETRIAVAQATEAISAIRDTARDDLPMLLSDVSEAVAEARGVIAGLDLGEAGADLSTLVADARTTLDEVGRTFANANETLGAINTAMETGDRALAAAESAFSGADRAINEDVPLIVAELEAMVQGLNAAVGTVADDLPAISADLREASSAASAAFGRLERLVDTSGPGVEAFAANALPAYERLAQETRDLIANLDRLTEQIEQSPTRFFLERDVPEFRR